MIRAQGKVTAEGKEEGVTKSQRHRIAGLKKTVQSTKGKTNSSVQLNAD
jgi:hypothetical protein